MMRRRRGSGETFAGVRAGDVRGVGRGYRGSRGDKGSRVEWVRV